jgi:carboxypeptidase C (cathepsin A)
MPVLRLALCAVVAIAAPLSAQDSTHKAPPKPSDTATVKEDSSVTDHVLRINGQVIPYRATVGNVIIKNAKGEPIGLMYYTAYVRTDTHDAGHMMYVHEPDLGKLKASIAAFIDKATGK